VSGNAVILTGWLAISRQNWSLTVIEIALFSLILRFLIQICNFLAFFVIIQSQISGKSSAKLIK